MVPLPEKRPLLGRLASSGQSITLNPCALRWGSRVKVMWELLDLTVAVCCFFLNSLFPWWYWVEVNSTNSAPNFQVCITVPYWCIVELFPQLLWQRVLKLVQNLYSPVCSAKLGVHLNLLSVHLKTKPHGPTISQNVRSTKEGLRVSCYVMQWLIFTLHKQFQSLFWVACRMCSARNLAAVMNHHS